MGLSSHQTAATKPRDGVGGRHASGGGHSKGYPVLYYTWNPATALPGTLLPPCLKPWSIRKWPLRIALSGSRCSLSSLMDGLATRVRVTYGLKADTSSPTFQQVPQPSPLQARVCQLLASYPVAGN
jgi:hypothetical protein